MSLGIFQTRDPDSKVSVGDFTNPIKFKQENAGGVEERQLFLRHTILAGDGAEFSGDVIVTPIDISPLADDVADWVQVAPDNNGVAGTYGAAGAGVNIGNVNLGDTVPFWIKMTVPVTEEIGAREDLALNVSTTETNTTVKDIDFQFGITSGDVVYDPTGEKITLIYQNVSGYGEFHSQWMDFTSAVSISHADVSVTSGAIFDISYRTADDDEGTNASDWVADPEDVDLSTQNFVQIRVQMYGQNVSAADGLPGLTRQVWTNTSWSGSPTWTDYGYLPHSGNPAGPYRTETYAIRCTGYIYLPVSGTYTFKTQSDDPGRWYIDGAQLTNANVSTHTSAPVYFAAGWYPVQMDHAQGGGGYYFYNWITVPGQAERPVTVNDFVDGREGDGVSIPDNNTKTASINSIDINYVDEYTNNYDIQFFIGPATPELIDPEDAYQTQEFNPPLTVISIQADFIQFQMDMSPTFDTEHLVTWEAAAVSEQEVTSQSPYFDRQSGVWYWRARAKFEGVYGNWSDYRNFTILPFLANDEFLYFNVNSGFDFELDQPRYYYLNVNVGQEEANLYFKRHIYLNVNVGTGAGEVIYPLFDRTPARKTSFPEDSRMFTT